MKRFHLMTAAFILALLSPLCGETDDWDAVLTLLKKTPGVEITEQQAAPPFTHVVEIMLPQPLDHQTPGGEQFRQRLILSHARRSKPLIIITEGYGLGKNYIEELSRLLDANQLRVEHRYFGKSAPRTMDWSCLNLEQAADDYHRIVRLFASVYNGPRVASGWSKGGQTALYWRYRYPQDVNVTVAYDAPLNFAVEDPRIDAFFDQVGTPECREKLHAFQRLVLSKKAALLPLLQAYAQNKKLTYSIGLEKALEYIVLEYTFSFWQYHQIPCDDIPGGSATDQDMFNHLEKVVSFWSYSDAAMESPSMFQFCTELGYYGYVQSHLRDLLSGGDYSNCAYAPRGVPLQFSAARMRALETWLAESGNNIICIYGGRDPWSAPAVQSSPKTNRMICWLENGNHFTFINTLPADRREKVLNLLKEWLAAAK